jgi:hypothetical protein
VETWSTTVNCVGQMGSQPVPHLLRPQRDSNPGERARPRAIWRDFARSDRVVCTR